MDGASRPQESYAQPLLPKGLHPAILWLRAIPSKKSLFKRKITVYRPYSGFIRTAEFQGDPSISTKLISLLRQKLFHAVRPEQKYNKNQIKSLLYSKKLSVFNGVFALFFVFILAFSAVLALPRTTHAGMLSALARFFGVYPREVEERLPTFIAEGQAAGNTSALDAENRPPDSEADRGEDDLFISVVRDNAILAPLNPLGTMPVANGHAAGQIFIYTIRPGDNIGNIAKTFDVTVNTILWANSISNIRSLKVGDQLIILPVSGIKYEVKKGDTLASIAKKYRATAEDITQFNGLAAGEEPTSGATIIIPNGELTESTPVGGTDTGQLNSFGNLPLYEGFYIRPISGGRRSRGIHGYNGIDLANTCGLPVLASADGTVIIARGSGWNGGYGRYVAISHLNGTQTLYAHMKELNVTPGQTVRQGEVIGSIGSSGNSTGCHVHFEVRGAKNPF